ncbi:putative O-glycosylation ligase, exosortase A system-associated [Photobacterium sp. BZF1]|uniref:putative O-glycosylation ligase, exosortase A system-associated n=1 Tax=Photobacterium sp. BZF1 TaxID=1904457 RepID=UPI0016537E5A|nr:putative O-glycosylation ligase, exosortase A system-associated [Photobacterium sp. BZF1]MBC7004152.1 putative O-glycosylation ligase, exosortase A system-associated [Photobacterium sp. BZF1]
MRSLALLLALPILTFAAFKRLYLALSLWVWSALVPPHIWAYGGVATSIRWNFVFALITIFGFIFNKEKKNPTTSILIIGLLFFIHTTLTSLVNYGDGPYVWLRWDWFMRVFLLFFFICLVIKRELHFEAIAWAVTLSLSFKAFIEGAKVLSSFGGHNIHGLTPGFNDNNLAALGSLMSIPFVLYLADQYSKNTLFKYGLYSLAFFNVLFVLGTDSRGGFIGLVVLAIFFFIKTKHKFKVGTSIMAIGLIALNLMTDDWFERMDTISDANEDGSFMSRVKSWKLAIIMAINSPIFGGGFDSTFTNKITVSSLVLDWDLVSFIPSSPINMDGRVYVAHSIYFQVLADHGFLGIILYLLLFFIAYKTLSTVYKKSPLAWQRNLAEKMKLTITVFLVSGAALSSAYNDLIFTTLACSAALGIAFKRTCDISDNSQTQVRQLNEQSK